MELPIDMKDVSFIMMLIQKHLRKKHREYVKPKQQAKLQELSEHGRQDYHFQNMMRAEALLGRLEEAVPEAKFIHEKDTPLMSQ